MPINLTPYWSLTGERQALELFLHARLTADPVSPLSARSGRL